MPSFVLLADPACYRPCAADDLLVDARLRGHWLEQFKIHFELMMMLAAEAYQRPEAAKACLGDFCGTIDALAKDPGLLPEFNVLTLVELRQKKLLAHGLPDPFLRAKERENAAMLRLYPRIVAELDSHIHESPKHELKLLVEGIFAGNIFDLGSGATAARFCHESPDFLELRRGLDGTRPWLVDHFDLFAGHLLEGPRHRKALFFLDNAGSDCILGVLPFCRYLARRGTAVGVAANRLPALNDVTYAELCDLFERISALDPVFAELVRAKQLFAVDSGGTTPLLDLREVPPELNAVAADADLLFLEGMGRALESNYDGCFTVDTVKLCMIKEQKIAEKHGGKIYDTIFRYDPRPGRA